MTSGCCHVSSSDSKNAVLPVEPRHRTLWCDDAKRTACLLVEKTSLQLRTQFRSEDTACSVHKEGHLVAHEADVALGVREHRE